MTILGTSQARARAPEGHAGHRARLPAFVELMRWWKNRRASRYTGAEDSYITSCASAKGIAIAVAAPSPAAAIGARRPDAEGQYRYGQ